MVKGSPKGRKGKIVKITTIMAVPPGIQRMWYPQRPKSLFIHFVDPDNNRWPQQGLAPLKSIKGFIGVL
jgi:hypothetical protein